MVTGARLRTTKVDYRLRGASLFYCGPRDAQQDAASVSNICRFVETCVLRGKRKRADLSACVEDNIAAAENRTKPAD